ncbi:MAG: DEAD/DEAH box helicase family protein [Treponema sp.]|jgi:superfamily II DNA or RNA helicase|nr:DEAD/DEAH box helicase family protein [Treponema sp.]
MARNKYGVTPWGAWFVEVLGTYGVDARLDRGRTYANTGKVLSLEIKDRQALAKVKGHSRPFYRVLIDFPALQDAEKEQIYRIIEEDPALLGRIAAGELPEDFLARLRSAGINLIPKRWRDMKRACNCPDYGDPCKHMAALYYIIAREIDGDPSILFRLRGLDLGARFGAAAVRAIAPPFEVKTRALPREGQGLPPEIPELPLCAELVTSLLPPAPSFSERDFALTLGEFYHHAARWVPWDDAAFADEDAPDTLEHRWSRSRWRALCEAPMPGALPTLRQEAVDGTVSEHGLYEAFLRFRAFSRPEGSVSYRFLFCLFKLLNVIIAAGAFIPAVSLQKSLLRIVWKPFETLPEVERALAALAAFDRGIFPMGDGTRVLTGRSAVDLLASALLGEFVKKNYFDTYLLQNGPKGMEFRELCALFFHGDALSAADPALRGLPLEIDRWLSPLHIDFAAFTYSLSLKPVRTGSADEAGTNVTIDDLDSAPDFDLYMEVRKGDGKAAPLCTAAKRAGADTVALLRAPTALSNYLDEIRALITHKSVHLSEARLVNFLDSAAPLLARLGLVINLPRAMHRELRPRLVLTGDTKERPKAAGSLVSYLDLDSLVDFHWAVAIGDETLSPAEFKKLLAQKRAIVRFKNRYVRIDPAELAGLLKKAEGPAPERQELLKQYFLGNSVLDFDAERILKGIFAERHFERPAGLAAELRPYQERGCNWIMSLLLAGFGCILADDMGLGKTVQAITAILLLRQEGLLDGPCLVVAPASLIENWQRELARFAPSLQCARYHGPGRTLDCEAQVFVTTFQTAVRDAEKMRERVFSFLIVDEAHLLKNAETRGAKTVRTLRAKHRLALSGTPVENRLEDLRSIFDLVLPGFLGSPEAFKNEYRIPIEVLRNAEKAEALRKITSPFLLRRVKTDKAIIADLPEKIISNEYAALEKEQAALYESVVSEMLEQSERIEDPAQRPLVILSLLTSLKQICDHPRVYDKESPAVSTLSGKALLLVTLLREILEAGEKTLIFSQYVETLECLAAIIGGEMGERTLLYHGGLSQGRRAAAVDAFQNDPEQRIMLVSLRAGGLGLNLTAASRVIHYDLWYNPAVENQATDRCFRIGQKRNVFVHRFITRNSFEEKIDAMLTSKKELADMTVSSGESWLSRMSHAELRDLFGG